MILRKLMMMVVILLACFVLYFSIPSSWFGFGTKSVEVTRDMELIDLDVSGVSTKMVTEERDNVEAKLDGKGQLQVRESGRAIEIEYKRSWFQSFPFFKGPELTIYIPEDYDRDIDIEVGSGNLTYEGKSKEQPILLNQLSLDLSSGNVHMANIQVKNGTFDIHSGNVGVSHYQGKFEAEVSSGNLKVQMDELTDSIEMNVHSGHAVVDLPNDADFTLDGSVNSGSITNSFSLKNKEENKRAISGVHGSGKYNVELSVSSGKIAIK